MKVGAVIIKKKQVNNMDDPLNDINWQYYWEKELKNLPSNNKSKDWDNIAKKFEKWMEKDDYPEKVLNKIQTMPQYSVLDIGCGEGVLTIPLAKKVSNVTCVDLSKEMLELLKKKAKNENLDNLNYIQGNFEDIDLNTVGKQDIVIASRSLNGIMNIEGLLKKLNEIGTHIYITLWGPGSRKYEDMARNVLNRENSKYPSYMYVCNILYQMGIIANVEKMECETINTYETIEEAMDRYRWKIGNLDQDENILRNHLENTLIKNDDGTFKNPYEKPDWILIWWKND